jgi:2,3-bisphosphoglycerate-dependent phosphoglycerate mutase
MALSAWVGDKRFEIGDAAFFKAWFSTIFVRLENENWGSVFPVIMHDLYRGGLPHSRAAGALKELEIIRRRLTELPPDQVVWDFENSARRPPWGEEISSHITSLGNYFVTSDGKDLFAVLASAFAEAAKANEHVVIS